MEADIQFPNGSTETVEFEQLTDRGEIGSANWGVGDGEPKEELRDTYQQIEAHIGKPAVLSGGGGRGIDLVVVEGVTLQRSIQNDELWKVRVAVRLIRGFNSRALSERGRRGDQFTPWLDSWQLSIPKTTRGTAAAERYVRNLREANDVFDTPETVDRDGNVFESPETPESERASAD